MNKKVVLEDIKKDNIKRMILEQGSLKSEKTNTPQWNNMKIKLKEGFAEKSMIFSKSFIQSLLPAFIISIILVITIFSC